MANEPVLLTVGGLYRLLSEVLADHPEIASKTVLLPDDEEGNGYHAALPCLTFDPRTVQACLDTAFCPDGADGSNSVILG